MKKSEILKYIIVLAVTVGLFATIFYATDRANNRRVSAVRIAQDTIAINLLSSETQFNLLKKTDCSAGSEEALFKNDLKSVGDRLTYLETTVGKTSDEVVNLKKYYSLLELKDYVLLHDLADRCGFKPSTIVYFTDNTCGADCEKQEYALAGVREKYPELRIYSFDAGLDLAAINTFKSINKIPDTFPVLMIDGKVLSGFQSIELIEKAAPELQKALDAKIKAEEKTANTKTKKE